MKSFKLTNRGKVDEQKLDRLSVFGPIIFSFICGVLLIAFRQKAVEITAYVLSAIMIVLGAWAVIIYIRSGELERITQSNLAIGLVLLVGGVMLAINPEYMDEFLPFVWGLSLLFGGFQKIQFAFDEKTVKVEKWWIMLILAGVSIALGIFVLLKPSFMEESKYLIMGILLVLEAILDLTVYLLLRDALKKRGISIHGEAQQAAVQVQENVPETISEAGTAAEETAEETAETGDEEEQPEKE